jgi:hypothetical protein
MADQMPNASHLLYEIASEIMQETGHDPLEMAGALGHAMTRMIHYAMGGDPDKCLKSAKIMADCSIKSMADIIAGQDSPDNLTQ